MPDNLEGNVAGQDAVDQAIATVETEIKEAEDQKETSSEVKDSENKTSDESGFVPFPEKAKNAIKYRDRKYRQARAQLEQRNQELESLRSELEKLRQSAPEKQGPKEDDYETYADFIKASAIHEMEKKMEAAEKARSDKQGETVQDKQKEQFVQARVQDIAQKAKSYIGQIPDFQKVVQDNVAIIRSFPKEVQEAFYNPQIDASLAFYNLAKTGELSNLGYMSRDEALITLARAQNQPKPQTKAPKPMESLRGVGSSNAGNLANDPNAMRKWLNS